MTALSATLDPARLVDLTQTLGPDTVLWPGSTPFRAVAEVTHETHGALARDLAFPEHSGTHLDAPIHFHEHGAPVEAIPLAALVRPVAVIDVSALAADDSDFALGLDHLHAAEQRDGEINGGDAVLVRFGWDAHTRDARHYHRFPGLSTDAARELVGRGVAGIGVDTLGVDPASAVGFPVHHITLPAGLWHLEGLVGLDRLPPRGAWLVAAVIPVVGGSGAPARVFAILPG